MKSAPRSVIVWLLCGCVLIASMVAIGGVTRLTGSGLSITEWNIVTGVFPPLNDIDWQREFEKYKQSPQFQKINTHFTLSNFQSIYWWEYIHRLVGRIIGVVFVVPFVYFLVRKKLSGSLIRKLLLLCAMGGFQGFLGWYMVASGLVENPYVSHYRLAIHLTAAFVSFGYCFWLVLELTDGFGKTSSIVSQRISRLVHVIAAVVLLQIIYGAFVAGLHAGKNYNTFPTMNGVFIPDFELTPWLLNMVEGVTGVQFIHRLLAYGAVGLSLWLWTSSRKSDYTRLRNAANLLLLSVGVQFVLGVFTLLYSVPLTLGVFHQFGALVVFMSVVNLLYIVRVEMAKK